jgi:hypothetical protein
MTHPLLLLALIFATSLLAFVPTFGGVFLLAVHDARTATILRRAPAAAPSPVDSESNSPGSTRVLSAAMRRPSLGAEPEYPGAWQVNVPTHRFVVSDEPAAA